MQKIALVRHGETEWALQGKHTGRSDIPLTPRGVKQAESLAPLLKNFSFQKAFVSPLKRAKDTFLHSNLQVETVFDEGLYEWDYGKYEGLTTAQIREKDPNWSIFTHGAPDGESIDQIRARADLMLEKARKCSGDVVFFSSGHILRSIAARWLEMPISFSSRIPLSTGSLSLLGYERDTPVLLLWNQLAEGAL